MLPAALLILAVAALAIVLRASGGRRDAAVSMPGGATDEPARDDSGDADGMDEDGRVEAAAITSDGWAFVPTGQGLELIPPGEDDALLRERADRHGAEALEQALAAAPVNPQTGNRLVDWRPGVSLGPGDLIAARVVRGAPSVDPWRLEALGRDHDYRAFAFETREAAHTALDLVERRIVRPPRDGHGDSMPVGVEDFIVARRNSEETEQALAMEPDDDRND